MTILVIIEHDKGAIAPATFNTITAASMLAEPVEALVAGDDIKQVANAALQIASISKVLIADSGEYAHHLAENLAPLIQQIAQNLSLIHI